MAYLLDTNILSDLVRNPGGRVRDAIARVGQSKVHTSIIVASELRYGAMRKGSATLTARVDAILDAIQVLPLEEPFDARYAEVRCALEAAGRPIGAMDMLIAAHALASGNTLVTDNTAEFARVPGLAVENWLR